jgi:hypothetical protein
VSRWIFALAIALAVFGAAQNAGNVSQPAPKATKDRLREQSWWPTKGTTPLHAYAGATACRPCHAEQASTQVRTPMAQAALRVGGRSQLPKIDSSTLQSGPYSYRISSESHGARLIVSSGDRSVSAKISWVFGAGVHGRTYILESSGNLYESQVSSFAGLRGLDLTPGHAPMEPGDVKNALGERLSSSTGAWCFGCHTTYSSMNSKFDAARAVPGVHCEACHGPGADHIREIKAGQMDEASAAILNPARLGPVDSVDFCGACHRTAIDVVEAEVSYGPMNVRFQPYRLEKSRCWGRGGDARLTCIACHDPHQPLVKDARSYDRRCLSCHASSGNEAHGVAASAPACKKAAANCTSCHMPKFEAPGMHAQFTDHFIRVVRAGESYPN